MQKLLIYGSSNIGVYSFVSEEISLLPPDCPQKVVEAFREVLGTEVLRVSVCNSPLLGVFVAGNSNGLLLPRYALAHEVELLKESIGGELNVEILSSRKSAVGNLILANDKAAVVSPLLEKKYSKLVEDVLGVEVVVRGIGGSPLVGSIAHVTNKGLLVFPLASDEELRELSEIFRVVADVGTVNRGSIFIRTGLVANSRGAIVGYDTTGPELMRIYQVFFGGGSS